MNLTREKYQDIISATSKYLTAESFDQLPTYQEIEHLNLRFANNTVFEDDSVTYIVSSYQSSGDLINDLSTLSHLHSIDVVKYFDPDINDQAFSFKVRGVLKKENKTKGYLKLYIATLDTAPDYMYGTLVAHSVLGAHLQFTADDHEEYQEWLNESFRKVTVRVSQEQFDAILAMDRPIYQGYENTICDGKTSCLVTWARHGEVPDELYSTTLWKPKK